ncbi:MAG: carbohydrate-binding family 9-like protein [Isosphaeraceae bacterium]
MTTTQRFGLPLSLFLIFNTTLPAAGPEQDMVTRQAVCRWAEKPPVLDGKLDDPCWKHAAVIDRFASFWTKTPRAGTKAYLVWDDEAIYYAGTMSDTEVKAFGTHRNDTLWDGDVFELFLKPSADRPEYFEFQANPRGLIFEMAFVKRGQSQDPFNKSRVLGNHAVVAVDGTLDHPDDKDRGWTVEGRIPWSACALAGGKPKAGDSWLFAICRYDHYGPVGTKPILMSCAPLTQPNFHRHEDYATLKFEGPRKHQ